MLISSKLSGGNGENVKREATDFHHTRLPCDEAQPCFLGFYRRRMPLK